MTTLLNIACIAVSILVVIGALILGTLAFIAEILQSEQKENREYREGRVPRSWEDKGM